MRIAISLAVAAAFLFGAPGPARADKCSDGCKRLKVSDCKKNCDKEMKDKDDAADCYVGCEMQKQLCAETCAIAARHKGDPRGMQREMKKLITKNSKNVPKPGKGKGKKDRDEEDLDLEAEDHNH